MAKTQQIVIVGAGGFAREVFQAVRLYNERKAEEEPTYECIGFLSDHPDDLDNFSSCPPIIGPIHGYTPDSRLRYILGIGQPKYRYLIASLFKSSWDLFPPFAFRYGWQRGLNRFAHLASTNVQFASGSCLLAINVSCDIKIGNFALVNTPYSLGHDVVIGDFCEVGPMCALGGRTVLEEGVHLAAGVVTAPGVRIGAWSKVAAGSTVMKNVPPGSFVIGVPGKVNKEFFLPYDGLALS